MKIAGTITFSEDDIRDAVAAEIARKFGIGVTSGQVHIFISHPEVAGARTSFEASVNVDAAVPL